MEIARSRVSRKALVGAHFPRATRYLIKLGQFGIQGWPEMENGKFHVGTDSIAAMCRAGRGGRSRGATHRPPEPVSRVRFNNLANSRWCAASKGSRCESLIGLMVELLTEYGPRLLWGDSALRLTSNGIAKRGVTHLGFLVVPWTSVGCVIVRHYQIPRRITMAFSFALTELLDGSVWMWSWAKRLWRGKYLTRACRGQGVVM